MLKARGRNRAQSAVTAETVAPSAQGMLEYKVLNFASPEPEKINVRRIMGEKVEVLRGKVAKAEEAMREAMAKKEREQEALPVGEAAGSTFDVKMRYKTACTELELVLGFVDSLPDRRGDAGDELHELQFDWLPGKCTEWFDKIAEEMAEVEGAPPP